MAVCPKGSVQCAVLPYGVGSLGQGAVTVSRTVHRALVCGLVLIYHADSTRMSEIEWRWPQRPGRLLSLTLCG